MDLLKLMREIADNAKNTGCSDDLTVVDSLPVDNLQEYLEKVNHDRDGVMGYSVMTTDHPMEGFTFHGFFSDIDSAIEYGEKNEGNYLNWWIVSIKKSEE